MCPDCSGRAARSSKLVFRSVGTFALLAMVGAVVWYAGSTRDGGFDYAKHGAAVDKARAALADEPCDRVTIVELTEVMLRAGDARGAIDRAEQFWAACGDLPRLRWVTYGAYKRLSEWDRAAAECTRLIAHRPYDRDYRTWRGLAYEHKGDWAAAATDYRQALLLEPRLESIPFNLAAVLEKAGRPCEALEALETFAYHHPKVRQQLNHRTRLDRLRSLDECASLSGSGKAALRFSPAESTIRARVDINGEAVGNFVVDTGAALVTLSRGFAMRAGVAGMPGQQILLATAAGVRPGDAATIRSVEVQGVKANRVAAVIIEDMPASIDGLLGLSFLARFDLTWDRREGVLTIEARVRP